MKVLATYTAEVERELVKLVAFFGEDPATVKPEKVFDTLAQFLANLRVRGGSHRSAKASQL